MDPSDERPVAIEPRRRHRIVVLVVVAYLGICELLTTTPWIDLAHVPGWLAGLVAITGFLTFLVLVGLFGNFLVAVGALLVVWRRWRWPLWSAVLISLPFWIVTYRVSPKPW